MQRLRISPFQAAILRRVCEAGRKGYDWEPRNRYAKSVLYGGRDHGFSTAERVTLHRSVRRLVANGLIETAEDSWGRRFRLTAKGRAWLEAADLAAPPAGRG